MPFFSKLFQKVKALLGLNSNKPEDILPSHPEKPELPHIDRTILLSELDLKCIFEYYTYSTLVSIQNSDFGGPLFIEADPRFGPLLLAQICIRWRRIVISMSHLWSSLHVGDNHHPDLLTQWLRRSGAQSLSLHLDCVHRPEEIAQANKQLASHPFEQHQHLSNSRISIALRLLSKEVHRWQRLSLALDIQSAFVFMQIPLDRAVNLKEISIQIVVRNSATMPPRVLHFLNTSSEQLPLLKRLSWESAHDWPRRLPPSEIPFIFDNSRLWERLNEVQLKAGVTMSEAAAFLGMCINASFVAIDCITNDYMDDNELPTTLGVVRWQEGEPITLSKLEELSIGFGGAACDCTTILERFDLPSLHTLRIYNFRTNQWSCNRIEDLLNHAVSPELDVVSDKNHPVGTPSIGLQRLLIKDDYMPEDVVFRLVSIAFLQRIPIVNLYTRKSIKWDFFSGKLLNDDSEKKVEYLEDLLCGKWIGWGGFPHSSLY